jgi:serine/threonine protein kinase
MRENAAANIDYDIEQLDATSKSAMNLLRQMLQKYPDMRPSAKKCMKHSFFSHYRKKLK